MGHCCSFSYSSRKDTSNIWALVYTFSVYYIPGIYFVLILPPACFAVGDRHLSPRIAIEILLTDRDGHVEHIIDPDFVVV